MRWKTLASGDNNEVYQLCKDDQVLLTLTLHRLSNTARVHCGDEKRVFLIRKEGFLKNRTVIRNEYGIKLGELGNENRDNFIEINGDRYYYTLDGAENLHLSISTNPGDKPLFESTLPPEATSTQFSLSRNKTPGFSALAILMAVCWYKFIYTRHEPAFA